MVVYVAAIYERDSCELLAAYTEEGLRLKIINVIKEEEEEVEDLTWEEIDTYYQETDYRLETSEITI